MFHTVGLGPKLSYTISLQIGKLFSFYCVEKIDLMIISIDLWSNNIDKYVNVIITPQIDIKKLYMHKQISDHLAHPFPLIIP